jgi:hypothetical protein
MRAGVAAFAGTAAGALIAGAALAPSASASAGTETIPGNPDCEDLGFPNGFKIEASGEFPAAGTYADGDEGTESVGDTEGFSVEIDYTDEDPLVLDFTSTIAVGAVLVKAGTGALAYEFEPPSTEGVGLESPKDDSISHITFCWGDGGPATTTTLPGSTTTTVPASTTTVPGSTTTLPGATTVPGGPTTTVPDDHDQPMPTPPAAAPVVDSPDYAG